MNTIHSAPALEGRTSGGQPKFWQTHIAQEGDDYFTYTTYWQTLADGTSSEVQESAYKKITPMNLGKKNETSPRDQAFFETNSEVKKKKDSGYFDIGGKPADRPLPMLAKSFEESGHRLVYPCVGQPKYDGNRAVSDGTAMWSRKGIEFKEGVVGHILAALKTLGYTVDGELIMPHGTALQDTNKAVKKARKESGELLYRVYDVIDPDKDYLERYELLKQIVEASNCPNITLTPIEIIESEEDALLYLEKCVAEGWEGIMLKNLGIGYKAGQRPGNAMIKLKEFMDAEFQILEVEAIQTAKLAGCARFILIAPPRVDKKGNPQPGGQFKSIPVGPIEHKQDLYKRREELLGTWWTIRFQDYTSDGKPTFNRAICERDADISG
jgi:hypothetical protein